MEYGSAVRFPSEWNGVVFGRQTRTASHPRPTGKPVSRHYTGKEVSTLVKENFANHLREYREKNDLSFKKLSKELDVTTAALNNYLKGCVDLRISTIGQVAEKCGLTVTEMISGLPPGWEEAKALLCAAAVLSRLSPERRDEGIHLFLILIELLSENCAET